MQPDTTSPDRDPDETLFEDGVAPVVKKATAGRSTRSSRKTAKTSAPAANKTTTSETTLDPGAELEIRLARMQFLKGAYTRRGIKPRTALRPRAAPSHRPRPAFDITARLTVSKTIGEAKSGTARNAPKPLDRAIWIAGLKQLVDADGGIVVTALHPSAYRLLLTVGRWEVRSPTHTGSLFFMLRFGVFLCARCDTRSAA